MTVSPDLLVKCRCGRSTYRVTGYEDLWTCSKCGYLTTYCKCKDDGSGLVRSGLGLPVLSDKARGMLGAGVISALGTLFFVTMLSSPFMALFGLGLPLGLTSAFFLQWLRDGGVRSVPVPDRSSASAAEAPGQVARHPGPTETAA